jgi:hypothetical protein
MSDLTTLTDQLSDMKTRMYNRLVAQGDTTIQANDSMETYTSHYESLYKRQTSTLNITENGSYTSTSSNISGYTNILVNVPAGGPATHKKYSVLDRVYDDGGSAIGTVSGFFTDKNGVEYAVVCLDAIYRATSVQWTSAIGNVTNMPLYNNWTIWEAPATATENTTLILASKTSSACTHCRQYSFVIDGTTYYGQLPNIIELTDIARHRTAINTADTSGGSIAIATNNTYWSSSQNANSTSFCVVNTGNVSIINKTSNNYACPVLEIPNQ